MSPSNRRQFLKTGVIAGTMLSTVPQWLSSCQSGQSADEASAERKPVTGKYFDHIGIQLYTLRDAFEANPAQTLKDIADVGYKELELHNVNLLTSHAAVLADMGLSVTSSHFPSAYLTGQWEVLEAFGVSRPADVSFSSILEVAAKHQLPYLVMPMLFPQERGDLDRYKELAAIFNRRGEECKKAGVKFCYHNHSFEFEPMNGTAPMAVLFAETDPELVAFELDIFWVKASGSDPVSFMKSHPDRIRLLHLKDLKAGIPPSYNTMEMAQKYPEAFVEVGNGTINFRDVLTAAGEIGVTNCYVEQDRSGDPLASITASYKYLSGLGL